VFKNRNDPELSEADFQAGLNHSKQFLRNIHPVTLASFCSPTKRYLQWPHRTMTDCTHMHQPRRKVAWQDACSATQVTLSH